VIGTKRKSSWKEQNFVELLQELAPAYCVLSYNTDVFEFKISKNGLLGSSISLHNGIVSELYEILEQNASAAVIVRSLTDQNICIADKDHKNTLIRAQIKEIRGYQLFLVKENANQVEFDFVHLAPHIVEGVYFQFDRNNRVNHKEYRFA